jgi:hypothetical protein
LSILDDEALVWDTSPDLQHMRRHIADVLGRQMPQPLDDAAVGSNTSQGTQPLPPGWAALTSSKSGDVYYFHEATGASQWDVPKHSDENTRLYPRTIPENDAETTHTAQEISLPPGWEAMVSSTTGETYYFHEETDTTQWEFPEEGDHHCAQYDDDAYQSDSAEQHSEGLENREPQEETSEGQRDDSAPQRSDALGNQKEILFGGGKTSDEAKLLSSTEVVPSAAARRPTLIANYEKRPAWEDGVIDDDWLREQAHDDVLHEQQYAGTRVRRELDTPSRTPDGKRKQGVGDEEEVEALVQGTKDQRELEERRQQQDQQQQQKGEVATAATTAAAAAAGEKDEEEEGEQEHGQQQKQRHHDKADNGGVSGKGDDVDRRHDGQKIEDQQGRLHNLFAEFDIQGAGQLKAMQLNTLLMEMGYKPDDEYAAF